jgi:hypothetical protein
MAQDFPGGNARDDWEGCKVKRTTLALFLTGMTISGTAIAGLGNLVFTRSDPAAIVMVEEAPWMQDGELLFQKVDLTTMRAVPGFFAIDKRPLNGRLTTKISGLRITNFGPYNNHSRFSGIKRPAGDYALVGYNGHDWLFGPVHGCPAGGAPVFRFKAGSANLITGAMLPKSSAERSPFEKFNATSLAANGSTDAVGDAQQVLNERKGIQADVVKAEYLGKVEFRGGLLDATNYCGVGKVLTIVEKP